MLMLNKFKSNNTISCGVFDLHIEHLVGDQVPRCEVRWRIQPAFLPAFCVGEIIDTSMVVFHSWRKAWSGSSFAARCAGSNPATRPMKVENTITPSARVRVTTKKLPRTGSSR